MPKTKPSPSDSPGAIAERRKKFAVGRKQVLLWFAEAEHALLTESARLAKKTITESVKHALRVSKII